MEPLYLSTEGMTDTEQMLLSMVFSIASSQLTRRWIMRQGGSGHVVIYDLSNSRSRAAWEQHRTLPHQVPVALSEHPIPDSPWILQKPVRAQQLIPLLNSLADWIEKHGLPADLHPCSAQRPNDPLGALRERLGAVAAARMSQAGALHDLKLIISGNASAGKTAAIRTLSDTPPITTDMPASDCVASLKPSTTVDLDYGELSLPAGRMLRLYGVPCHPRFDPLISILCQNALGVVALINNRAENSPADVEYLATEFPKLISEPAVVVGVTHRDQAPEPSLDWYERRLHALHKPWPVFSVDPRNIIDVVPLLDALVTMLERAKGPHAVGMRL
jgi:signal recognition particle receptor subunit beta